VAASETNGLAVYGDASQTGSGVYWGSRTWQPKSRIMKWSAERGQVATVSSASLVSGGPGALRGLLEGK